MKKLHYTLFLFLFISFNTFSEDFQFYIYERYFNYSDNLRPSSHGDIFTYLQGPMIENAINENLSNNTKRCEAGAKSKYIFTIKPHIFYNYQMNILYGELKVKIFGPNNTLKDTVVIESQYQGKIHQKAEFYLAKIYDEMIKKLSIQTLNRLPQDELTINGNFCSLIEFNEPDIIPKTNYKKPYQA